MGVVFGRRTNDPEVNSDVLGFQYLSHELLVCSCVSWLARSWIAC